MQCQRHILSNNTLNRRAVEFYAVQLALSLSLSPSISDAMNTAGMCCTSIKYSMITAVR